MRKSVDAISPRKFGAWFAVLALIAAGILPIAAAAQTAITQTINASYSDLTSNNAIPNDFTGLSFETSSMQLGWDNVSGYFFASSDTQLVALFQQMGIKNLRIGGGTVGSKSYRPQNADVDSLFGFAQAAGVKVIYSLPVTDATNGGLSTDTEGYDKGIANYIWENSSYASLLHSFALGNEVGGIWVNDYIDDYWSPIQSSIASYIAGQNPNLPAAPFSGPDTGDYYGSNPYNPYTGALCGGSVTSSYWAYGFAYCAKNAPWTFFTTATNHYYVGGTACHDLSTCTTQDQAATDMLSYTWVTGDVSSPGNPGTEACGTSTCPYYPFQYLYNTMLTPIVALPSPKIPYRLTELDERDGGTVGASNAFAGALFALDVMHWFALNKAAGTNFHNNPWIPNDTIVPGDLTQYQLPYPFNTPPATSGTPFACANDVCDNFQVVPKGYGIKAFDMGGHGFPVAVSGTVSSPLSCNGPECSMPNSTVNNVTITTNSIDTYAVGSGQDLYVTLVNKTYAPAPASDKTANVTIDISAGVGPFVAASVATLQLWNGDSSSQYDPTQAQLPNLPSLGCDPAGYTPGCGAIVNTGAQWAGQWTAQSAMTSGSATVSVPPGQAMIVHFHAASNYVGPVQIDQNGALEMAIANKSNGDMYHMWQLVADVKNEPNSAPGNWSAVSNFTGTPQAGNPAGDIAEVKNLDNSLTVFVPTSGGDVFYTQQLAPNGEWGAWTDMGSSSAGLSHLKAGQNADGSLTVFGLDSSGDLWHATENAPGVAWSSWTELSGKTIDTGYVVGDNLSGRLEVFGENGGNVYHIWQTLSNGWSSWAELATGETLNGWLQVARDVSGDLWVFALDSSGNVWSNNQKTPSGGWQSSWSPLPGAGTAIQPGFVAGQDANGNFELFGVGSGTSVNVRHIWTTSPGTWATSWPTISSGAPSGGFDPHLMVSNTNDGRLQIFAVAASSPNDIWTNWQGSIGGAWNGWEDDNSGCGTSTCIFYPGQP